MHIAANGIISVFFMVKKYSIVYMCHIFFIHSSVDEYLDCFHVLTIILPLWTLGCTCLFELVFSGYILSLCDRTRTETQVSCLLSETSWCQDTSKVFNYVLQISSIFVNEEGSCIQFEGGIYNPNIDGCSPLLSEVSGYGKKLSRLHWHDSLCDWLNSQDHISGNTRTFFVLSLILSPRM